MNPPTMKFSERPAAALVDKRLTDLRAAAESALDGRAKVEILGGAIVVSPMECNLHLLMVAMVAQPLFRQLDLSSFIITERAELIVDPLNFPQPDLTVLPEASVLRNLDAAATPAGEASIVMEVTSLGGGDSERKHGVKYTAYAKGGVPIYVLVDPYAETGPSITVFTEPDGSRYNAETTVKFGEPLRLPEPFDAVEIDSSRFPNLAT